MEHIAGQYGRLKMIRLKTKKEYGAIRSEYFREKYYEQNPDKLLTKLFKCDNLISDERNRSKQDKQNIRS